VVRVQIGDDMRMDGLEGTDYTTMMENLFQVLDARLPLLEARGLKLHLCLYSPPGGFSTREAPSHYAMFSRPDLQAAFVNIWQTIATRYGANPTVAAFDLANEPAMRPALLAAGAKDWNKLAADTVAAVRAIAPTKTIIIKSLYGDPTKLKRLPLFDDPNIEYAYNSYFYPSYQHSGVYGNSMNISRPTDAAILTKVRKLLAPFFLSVHQAVQSKKVSSVAYPPKVVIAEAAVSVCARESGSFLNGLLAALEADEATAGAALRAKTLRKWQRARRKNRRLPRPTFRASDFLLDVSHIGYAVHAYDEYNAWDPRYSCTAEGLFFLSPTETEQATVIKSYFSRNS